MESKTILIWVGGILGLVTSVITLKKYLNENKTEGDLI